jgi:predicted DNA-binding transcriptional regulator YafY
VYHSHTLRRMVSFEFDVVQGLEVHPLGLVLVDKVVYLLATFEEYTDVRQLAFHRIHSAEMLTERSSIPAGFSLKQYVESGEFRYVLREGTIALKLRMAAGRAKHLAETRLSETQQITTAKDGLVLIEAEVADTHQLRFWLKGFGADVEVLAPSYLRREMRREAQALAAIYSRRPRARD